ncbi:hypothetical protein L7F22_069025 [Adiantum nelumboides]|nr:hypothetical protein [Adiantum nelumboides]
MGREVGVVGIKVMQKVMTRLLLMMVRKKDTINIDVNPKNGPDAHEEKFMSEEEDSEPGMSKKTEEEILTMTKGVSKEEMGKEMSKRDDKIKEYKGSSDATLNTIIHWISKLEKEGETYNKEKEAWKQREGVMGDREGAREGRMAEATRGMGQKGAAAQPIPILSPPSLPDPPALPVITPSTSHPVPPIQPPDVSPDHALSDSDSDLDVADATPEVDVAPPRQEKRIPGWLYSTSEACGSIRDWKAMVEKEKDLKVKSIRSDRGGEFLSENFARWCKSEGIRRQLTTPYTPSQNGVVERKNRTIMEMARAMLAHASLSRSYWAEACDTTVYIQNRSPTHALQDMTPFQAYYGRKPTVSHFRVFGCSAFVHIPKEKRQKLDFKSRKLLFLGYSAESDAYRLYDPDTMTTTVSRDVVFDESFITSAEGAAAQPIPILSPPSLPDPPASPVITPSTSHPVPPIQPPDVSPDHALSDFDSDLDVADATPEVDAAPPRQEKRIPGWLYSTQLQQAARDSLVEGLPTVRSPTGVCEPCQLGKQHRVAFPKQASTRASAPLALVHTDLCGPMSTSSLSGLCYMLVLVDDFSRYTWVSFLKLKSEAFGSIRDWKAMVEKEKDLKVKSIRSDRGGEFLSENFARWCKSEGIRRLLTTPYTPSQNGVVERNNRTIMEMARAMLSHASLPRSY